MSSSTTTSVTFDLASLGTFKTLQLRWVAESVLNVHISSGKLNTMTRAFWSEMREAFTKISTVKAARVILVTAAGKFFTAGLDLNDHSSLFTPSEDGDVGRRAIDLFSFIKDYQQSFTAIENCIQPVVVAIQGPCIGGGVDLITACDIRLTTKEAYFSIKEVDIGMAADVGTLQRLPKVVANQSLVREWCYTGRNISSQEALTAGLVSNVYETSEALHAAALQLCKTIAEKSPLAVSGTKKMLLYSRDHSVAESLDQVALWNSFALQSHDVPNAVLASMKKKKPVYSNL